MSLAAMPEPLTENPRAGAAGDLLSEALRRVRITGSMQYLFHAERRLGDRRDARPL